MPRTSSEPAPISGYAPVRFVLTRDIEDFAARAERFLAARIELNVLATVLAGARRGRFAALPPLFACGIDGRGRLCAAAMRTPPWPLLASDLDDADADALVGQWLSEDPEVPGVTGPPDTARAIAASWRDRTGGRSDCRRRDAMHSLTDVSDPPRPAPGRLRTATDLERELLIVWENAFAIEARVSVSSEAEYLVTARLADGAQFVWDDDGPVSTLVLSPAIAGTVRVGPVYTPPERRCRGYASSAVAAAARRALAEGARTCMLFTDLANPTSNRIYATIGFRRFADWEEHTFQPR